MTLSMILITVLALVTLGVLATGLVVMIKGGGKENSLLQNKLMTYRIWLQAAAIGMIILLLSIK